MQRIVTALISCVFISMLSACSPTVPESNWTGLINEEAAFVLIPEPGSKLSDIAAKEYASYLDDLTASTIQQFAILDAEIPISIDLKALALAPSSSTNSQLLWIGEHPSSDISTWAPAFYQPFAQNNYEFKGHTVHKLFLNNSDVYAAQAGSWLVLSKSSLVLENALRTYVGELPAIDLGSEPASGRLLVNTPNLDHWLEQIVTPINRPSVLESLKGTTPTSLQFDTINDSLNNIQLSGKIVLDENRSALTDAFSYENKPIILDLYIGSDAAAFALFRLPPVSVPVEPVEQASVLDSLLFNDIGLYQEIAATLDNNFAVVSFPESGLQANGEYLFMRTVQNKSRLQNLLNDLAADDVIYKPSQSTYQISSLVLAKLVGSELAVTRDYYLTFSGNVAIIAKRRGLAESVHSDRTRRRVIYYDETYSNVRNTMPEEVSGFVWASSSDFLKFINPYLTPANVAGNLLSRFDIVSATMTTENEVVDLSINTYSEEGSTAPYRELWVLALENLNLSGKPVLGDLIGSSTKEIVIATQDGRVLVLASDGTVTTEVSTNGQEPVGGPVLYDWYGNGQQVILLAAGSQIFAWNSTGNLLPKFPLEMDQKISAPILVTDVLRNGVPEIIVATENRKVHVIDGRGDDVRGWPQNTNSIVTAQPVFELVENIWSVWAYSQNTLHSWLRNGNARPEYPQFINARFTGSPVVYNDQILGSAADGYLYSIGTNPLFTDSAATNVSTDSLSVQSLYVAGSELSSVSVEENVLLKDVDFYREDLITTQSVNGSIFLYNTEGTLRFTQSLGQPASRTLTPYLTDLNSDENMELIALAEFGRLYAWEVLTNERLYGIPTSGMKFPVITDLNGDGRKEIIAQTREGLRCWTIMRH